ncbi:hypothetical protein F0726_01258 [Acidithiobacillus caldus]|nr:hypothetical protein F0726_01258 [Acidithiobacillus caldus]
MSASAALPPLYSRRARAVRYAVMHVDKLQFP